jgi:hypothetical protein
MCSSSWRQPIRPTPEDKHPHNFVDNYFGSIGRNNSGHWCVDGTDAGARHAARIRDPHYGVCLSRAIAGPPWAWLSRKGCGQPQPHSPRVGYPPGWGSTARRCWRERGLREALVERGLARIRRELGQAGFGGRGEAPAYPNRPRQALS